jgi:hypothetical protein
LHAPLASHVFAPVHVSGSGAFVTGAQAPVPRTHFWQTPLFGHAAPQHTPSSQTLDAQSDPVLQPPPATLRYRSALLSVVGPVMTPPMTRTAPWEAPARMVVEPRACGVVIESVATKVRAIGSKSSALDKPVSPPATRTLPEDRAAAMGFPRAMLIAPAVAVKLPVAGSNNSASDVEPEPVPAV